MGSGCVHGISGVEEPQAESNMKRACSTCSLLEMENKDDNVSSGIVEIDRSLLIPRPRDFSRVPDLIGDF